MQARFFCKTGVLAGSDYRIGDDATVGRGPESTIVLASDVVSASHARIAFDAAAEAYFLEDLDSRNGTRLDGRPVSGRERLGDLHVVTVGAHDFLFVVVPEDEPSPAREPASSAVEPEAEGATSYEAPSALAAPPLREGEGEPGRGTHYEAPSALAAPQLGADDADPATSYEAPSALAAPPLGADDAGPATSYEAPSALAAPPRDPAPPLPAGVVVEVRTPDGGRRRIPLDDGRHVLGRGQDCPIPVDDRTLSRRHAEFVVRGGRLTVCDLESLNGTFLGTAAVEKVTEVHVGQTVTLGERVQVVRLAPGRAAAFGDGGASDAAVGAP